MENANTNGEGTKQKGFASFASIRVIGVVLLAVIGPAIFTGRCLLVVTFTAICRSRFGVTVTIITALLCLLCLLCLLRLLILLIECLSR